MLTESYCHMVENVYVSGYDTYLLYFTQGELVSVNLDEEEYSSFQASADNVEHVRDPRTHKIITYDAACKLGLINKDAKTFHNPITNQHMSFQEASEKGFIRRKVSFRDDTFTHKPILIKLDAQFLAAQAFSGAVRIYMLSHIHFIIESCYNIMLLLISVSFQVFSSICGEGNQTPCS